MKEVFYPTHTLSGIAVLHNRHKETRMEIHAKVSYGNLMLEKSSSEPKEFLVSGYEILLTPVQRMAPDLEWYDHVLSIPGDIVFTLKGNEFAIHKLPRNKDISSRRIRIFCSANDITIRQV